MQQVTEATPLNLAPLLVMWDDNKPREVEESKKKFQQARRECRLIVNDNGDPIANFHPSLKGFEVLGPALQDTQFAVRIIDDTGDSTIVWDSNDAKEVAEASAIFQKQLKAGSKAFAVSIDGSRKRQIHHFSPDLQEITFTEGLDATQFKESVKKFVASFKQVIVTAPVRAG